MSNTRINGQITVFLVAVTFISLIHKSIFNIYSQFALYAFAIIAVLIILINAKISASRAALIIIGVIALNVALYINEGGLGSVVTFIVPFLLLYAFERVKVDRSVYKALSVISSLAIIILFLISFRYKADWWYHRQNSINPNSMAIFTLFAFMMWTCYSTSKRYRFIKCLTMLIMSLVAILFYNSRMALITLGVYCIGLLLIKKMQVKHIRLLAILILAISISFPLIYCWLYDNNIEITIFNKSLFTGREIIWRGMILQFTNNTKGLLFGLGSHAVLYEGQVAMNAHSNPYAVLIDFGIIGFALHYGYVFYLMKGIKNADILIKKLLLAFVCSAILLGMTEVTTLWPASYALVYSNLGLAYAKYKEMGAKYD